MPQGFHSIAVIIALWFVGLCFLILLFRWSTGTASLGKMHLSQAPPASIEVHEAALRDRERALSMALEALRDWKEWESRKPVNAPEREERKRVWNHYLRAFKDAFDAEQRLNAIMSTDGLSTRIEESKAAPSGSETSSSSPSVFD
jgi:hypothetical protein